MVGGYHNRFLRVNLSNHKIKEVKANNSILKEYVGGAGIGSYFLLVSL